MKLLKVVSLCVMMLFATGIAFTGSAYAEPVNINEADVATLVAELKGVGEVKAKAIIEYRTQNGPFGTVDDLQKVKGISVKTIENNRQNLTLK
ncbi:hypothetical protein MNBD_GAMMA10-3201 [hydrothermal vent metagenome]|uniref:Helix-hairpin-helix DNA-binding motif class 1 domain-containing protein n=1 Tax=hydrothermal vent metagenome TaxID=652676 RepID=A0A3B0XFA3_9ZZZZ